MALLPNGIDFQMRDMQNSGVNGAPTGQYVAVFTQSSTSAPTATVLANSLGTVTVARTSAGVYTLTAEAGTFPALRTHVLFTLGGTAVTATVVQTSDSVLTIHCGDGATPSAADIGGQAYIVITVYPAA